MMNVVDDAAVSEIKQQANDVSNNYFAGYVADFELETNNDETVDDEFLGSALDVSFDDDNDDDIML